MSTRGEHSACSCVCTEDDLQANEEREAQQRANEEREAQQRPASSRLEAAAPEEADDEEQREPRIATALQEMHLREERREERMMFLEHRRQEFEEARAQLDARISRLRSELQSAEEAAAQQAVEEAVDWGEAEDRPALSRREEEEAARKRARKQAEEEARKQAAEEEARKQAAEEARKQAAQELAEAARKRAKEFKKEAEALMRAKEKEEEDKVQEEAAAARKQAKEEEAEAARLGSTQRDQTRRAQMASRVAARQERGSSRMARMRADRIEAKVAQDLATLAQTERARMAEERRREHSRARQEREESRSRNKNSTTAGGVLAASVRVARRGDFWVIPANRARPDAASLRPLTDLLRSRHYYIDEMFGGEGLRAPVNWKHTEAGERLMVFYQEMKGKPGKGKSKGKDKAGKGAGKGKDQPGCGLKAVTYAAAARRDRMESDVTWQQLVVLRPSQMAELLNQVQSLWVMSNEQHIRDHIQAKPSEEQSWNVGRIVRVIKCIPHDCVMSYDMTYDIWSEIDKGCVWGNI